MLPLGFGPRLPHPSPDDLGIDVEECQPHVTGKREICVPIAVIEVVEKDAARSPRLIAVRQKEVLVAPLLESRIVTCVMRVAGPPQCGMKITRIVFVRNYGSQIGTTAEPAFRCHDM